MTPNLFSSSLSRYSLLSLSPMYRCSNKPPGMDPTQTRSSLVQIVLGQARSAIYSSRPGRAAPCAQVLA